MSWVNLATIALSRNWQYTDPVAGSLFRLTHNLTASPYGYKALIGQAFTTDQITDLADVQRVYAKLERDLVRLPLLLGLGDRRLALRRYDRYINPWSVQVEMFVPAASGDRELLIVTSQGQTSFNLTNSLQVPQNSGVFINGIKATYGIEYRIEGFILTWLDPLVLDPSDEIELLY